MFWNKCSFSFSKNILKVTKERNESNWFDNTREYLEGVKEKIYKVNEFFKMCKVNKERETCIKHVVYFTNLNLNSLFFFHLLNLYLKLKSQFEPFVYPMLEIQTIKLIRRLIWTVHRKGGWNNLFSLYFASNGKCFRYFYTSFHLINSLTLPIQLKLFTFISFSSSISTLTPWLEHYIAIVREWLLWEHHGHVKIQGERS